MKEYLRGETFWDEIGISAYRPHQATNIRNKLSCIDYAEVLFLQKCQIMWSFKYFLAEDLLLHMSHCTVWKTIIKMALWILPPFIGLFNFPLSSTFILDNKSFNPSEYLLVLSYLWNWYFGQSKLDGVGPVDNRPSTN